MSVQTCGVECLGHDPDNTCRKLGDLLAMYDNSDLIGVVHVHQVSGCTVSGMSEIHCTYC